MKKKQVSNIFAKDSSYNTNWFSVFTNPKTEQRFQEELLKYNLLRLHIFTGLLCTAIIVDYIFNYSEIHAQSLLFFLIVALIMLGTAFKMVKESSTATSMLSVYSIVLVYIWLRCLHLFELIDVMFITTFLKTCTYLLMVPHQGYCLLFSFIQQVLVLLICQTVFSEKQLLPSFKEFVQEYIPIGFAFFLVYHFVFVQIRKNWKNLDSFKKSDKVYQLMFLESLAPEIIIDINYRVICMNQLAKRMFSKRLQSNCLNFMNLLDGQQQDKLRMKLSMCAATKQQQNMNITMCADLPSAYNGSEDSCQLNNNGLGNISTSSGLAVGINTMTTSINCNVSNNCGAGNGVGNGLENCQTPRKAPDIRTSGRRKSRKVSSIQQYEQIGPMQTMEVDTVYNKTLPKQGKLAFHLKIKPYQWKGNNAFLIFFVDQTNFYGYMQLNDYLLKQLHHDHASVITVIEPDYQKWYGLSQINSIKEYDLIELSRCISFYHKMHTHTCTATYLNFLFNNNQDTQQNSDFDIKNTIIQAIEVISVNLQDQLAKIDLIFEQSFNESVNGDPSLFHFLFYTILEVLTCTAFKKVDLKIQCNLKQFLNNQTSFLLLFEFFFPLLPEVSDTFEKVFNQMDWEKQFTPNMFINCEPLFLQLALFNQVIKANHTEGQVRFERQYHENISLFSFELLFYPVEMNTLSKTQMINGQTASKMNLQPGRRRNTFLQPNVLQLSFTRNLISKFNYQWLPRKKEVKINIGKNELDSNNKILPSEVKNNPLKKIQQQKLQQQKSIQEDQIVVANANATAIAAIAFPQVQQQPQIQQQSQLILQQSSQPSNSGTGSQNKITEQNITSNHCSSSNLNIASLHQSQQQIFPNQPSPSNAFSKRKCSYNQMINQQISGIKAFNDIIGPNRESSKIRSQQQIKPTNEAIIPMNSEIEEESKQNSMSEENVLNSCRDIQIEENSDLIQKILQQQQIQQQQQKRTLKINSMHLQSGIAGGASGSGSGSALARKHRRNLSSELEIAGKKRIKEEASEHEVEEESGDLDALKERHISKQQSDLDKTESIDAGDKLLEAAAAAATAAVAELASQGIESGIRVREGSKSQLEYKQQQQKGGECGYTNKENGEGDSLEEELEDNRLFSINTIDFEGWEINEGWEDEGIAQHVLEKIQDLVKQYRQILSKNIMQMIWKLFMQSITMKKHNVLINNIPLGHQPLFEEEMMGNSLQELDQLLQQEILKRQFRSPQIPQRKIEDIPTRFNKKRKSVVDRGKRNLFSHVSKAMQVDHAALIDSKRTSILTHHINSGSNSTGASFSLSVGGGQDETPSSLQSKNTNRVMMSPSVMKKMVSQGVLARKYESMKQENNAGPHESSRFHPEQFNQLPHIVNQSRAKTERRKWILQDLLRERKYTKNNYFMIIIKKNSKLITEIDVVVQNLQEVASKVEYQFYCREAFRHYVENAEQQIVYSLILLDLQLQDDQNYNIAKNIKLYEQQNFVDKTYIIGFNATKRTNQYNLQYIDYLINGANFDKNELFSKMHIIENDFQQSQQQLQNQTDNILSPAKQQPKKKAHFAEEFKYFN